jgi:hypothetical protein
MMAVLQLLAAAGGADVGAPPGYDRCSTDNQARRPPPDCTSSPRGLAAACAAGATDCRPVLQAALDTCCPFVKVTRRDNTSVPWIISGPLTLRSHQKLLIEPGVELQAMKGEFKAKGSPLAFAFNVSNLTVIGYGATLRMHKLDYATPELGYVHSEARPGIWVVNASDVRVFGLTITASGGDGLE